MVEYRFLLTALLAVPTALALVSCERLSAPSAPLQPPKIVFQETTYDFGRIDAGTQMTHVYTFRNAGGLDLRIDTLRASCDCTAALSAARVIPPGAGGRIEATWDTARDFGCTTRTITVYANDPAQPVTTLTLVGNVDTDVAADPPSMYVGHLHRGEVARNELRLITTSMKTITLGPADAPGKVVDVTLHDAAARVSGRQLRVAIKPEAPLGRFKESMTVRTSSERRPILKIPVVGVVDG